MNVVIVDDSRVVREQLKELLSETAGITIVDDTDDIAQALRSATSASIDFYVLDISMPKGSGFTLLHQIRAKGLGGKVIMLTNYPDDYFRARANALGADYFFDKSTEFENVFDVLVGS